MRARDDGAPDAQSSAFRDDARRARSTLLVFVGLTIAAVAGQTWWDVTQDRRQTLASTHASGLTAVRLLDEHAAQTLADAERNLDEVVEAVHAAGKGKQLDDNALSQVVTGGQKDSRFLNALQFVSLDGKPYVNSSEYPAFQFDIDDRAYVKTLLANPSQHASRLGRPFQRFYDKETVLPLARNLYDRNGRHRGIISIDINVAYFSTVYARVAKDSGALVALYSDDGFVIVRSPFDISYLGLTVGASGIAARLRGSPSEGVFEDDRFLDLQGPLARQYTYRKLPAYNINIVYARSLDSILGNWHARTVNRLMLAVVSIVFICILTAFLWEHIARLDRSENALRLSEAEIRALNTGLEQRVALRTENLEDANRELQRALEALKATQRELLRSEKMAALGSLVAGVAHELNTPLGNSLTIATALQEFADNSLDELRHGHLRRSALEATLASYVQASGVLTRNLKRAAELVQSFKQVAVDQSANQRRIFDLAVVLEEIIATLEPTYKHSPYRLETELEPQIAMDGYPGALTQIVTNLVSNALAHAFEGRDSGIMRLQTRRAGARGIELVFSDDGTGIAHDIIERVFDPFFTTKMGRGGTGLGMHIVYNLVTSLLGGTVELSSSEDGGTRVCVMLPLVAPPAQGAQTKQQFDELA
ncbi:MAG: ATP-binding protein [Pseudomonadota bacterium]